MKYDVAIEIKENQKKVIKVFTDIDAMQKWSPTLLRTETFSGHAFETGSKTNLIFKNNDEETKMLMSIEKNELPERITIIYEVPGAWNRCVNIFKDMNGNTSWMMQVEFQFEKEMSIPESVFVNQTKKNMETFKQYVESL